MINDQNQEDKQIICSDIEKNDSNTKEITNEQKENNEIQQRAQQIFDQTINDQNMTLKHSPIQEEIRLEKFDESYDGNKFLNPNQIITELNENTEFESNKKNYDKNFNTIESEKKDGFSVNLQELKNQQMNKSSSQIQFENNQTQEQFLHQSNKNNYSQQQWKDLTDIESQQQNKYQQSEKIQNEENSQAKQVKQVKFYQQEAQNELERFNRIRYETSNPNK
ncbi:hypothetical protein PPERSA_11201 [Pseudocohnilembus persalinus]|uniref:Uncharacterized protein n=1 Tax=Pseudocohnilembus persalinus TaxID=266149 RepID=A0A0V0QZG7_PSEPJ|nr:hypothetical protein PPERSA_11201 [Pseudocohnilembus persalinus]|eukprot:KRX07652.1 hypothetical protein PPERSA_11201 [Pseudocohnilembus persalinus]